MTLRQRLSLLSLVDSVIVLTAIFVSSFIVNANLHVITMPIVVYSVTLLLGHHLFSYIYKLYKKSWEYASIGELLIIFKVITFSIIVVAFVQLIITQNIYYRMLAVTWMLHMLLIGGSRFMWRMFRDTYIKKSDTEKRTLIVGAGSAGTMIARQLQNNHHAELVPVAFIDDDIKKQHLDILGIPVIGGVEHIEKCVKELNIDNVVIAIPSLNKRELNVIFQECAKTNVKTQILPMIEDLATGKVSVNQFRDVQVEDLLGRESR